MSHTSSTLNERAGTRFVIKRSLQTYSNARMDESRTSFNYTSSQGTNKQRDKDGKTPRGAQTGINVSRGSDQDQDTEA
eukprot:767048-Hanusia_phi.AAC.6